MTDIVDSLFCEVHGEVTRHVSLGSNRWECFEPLGRAGVCVETRDGRGADEGVYGVPLPTDVVCVECGAIQSRYEGLRLMPHGCALCGTPLPIPTAEEAL